MVELKSVGFDSKIWMNSKFELYIFVYNTTQQKLGFWIKLGDKV